MNRKVFIQIALPGLIVGAILLGTCLVSAWYINRLQANLSQLLSREVISLEAAQELEICVRQMRYHCFLYLTDPSKDRLGPIDKDHQGFEKALELARSKANPQEEKLIRDIQEGYRRYHEEMDQLRKDIDAGGPRLSMAKLGDSHPIRHVVDPCQELLRINKASIEKTAQETEQFTAQAHLSMLLLGALGPLGGLAIGYMVARGLSRSIHRLSVHVKDMARHLDLEVATISLAADGDLHGLDHQLQNIVRCVEEVMERQQQHQREMLRAEQLASVGQLAAGVAHEVRNPLAAIKMLVEAAMRPTHSMPLSPQDLMVIHSEIARLETIVQGFLDFARLPTLRPSTCDLREVVCQSIDLVRARSRQQNVAVVLQSPEAPVLEHLDFEKMRTVIVNLLLNALDAMPQGGRIDVEITMDADGNARLVFADTGHGISPEIAGRLFTPFASTKPTGTGLGLSLSRRIVEEHGGSLTAENRAEGGARFILVLPGEKVVSGQESVASNPVSVFTGR
jgi:two-component system, NtrC family, sensor histidine kinase HydH